VLNGFDPRLFVEWRETCSQPPQWGHRGRELIEESLRYRMKADTTFEPTSSGLHCTMSLPAAFPPNLPNYSSLPPDPKPIP
jgi:hypothetical protein